jgi:hypothetical protein
MGGWGMVYLAALKDRHKRRPIVGATDWDYNVIGLMCAR